MVKLSKKMLSLGEKAEEAARVLRKASSADKNNALEKMALSLEDHTEDIIQANKKDREIARENGLPEPLIERLTLDEGRVLAMISGLRQVIALDDPLTVTDEEWTIENGLRISRRPVPLGVLGIIYESRPNVTADASALGLKAGNAVILRGGKEAINSNLAIEAALQEGLADSDIPAEAIQVIPNTDRKYSNELMTMNNYIDALIPRGGQGLIQAVLANATVPIIETGAGNSHIYIEKTADIEMARNILHNAKTQRPSVCNAAETVIVDSEIADEHLDYLLQPLKEDEVALYGDKTSQNLVSGMAEANDEHYHEEFLSLSLAVKVVDSYEEAVEHIERYSTHHSDAIVTSDYQTAQNFQMDIDSAAVYVNASTRFTDGEVFGFGGEIGISTQKLHARGPMGLEALTSYKYVIQGNGQIRE